MQAILIEQLLPVLLSGIGAAIAALIPFLIAKLNRWVDAKVKNETANGLLERLSIVVADAVDEQAQTVVNAAKTAADDGKLTKEDARAIKQAAINNAKAYLGEKGWSELKFILGLTDERADRLVGAKIEAEILRQKLEAAPLRGSSEVGFLSAPTV